MSCLVVGENVFDQNLDIKDESSPSTSTLKDNPRSETYLSYQHQNYVVVLLVFEMIENVFSPLTVMRIIYYIRFTHYFLLLY